MRLALLSHAANTIVAFLLGDKSGGLHEEALKSQYR
jgi:hypothetical protein